jgi:hypothetical protein
MAIKFPLQPTKGNKGGNKGDITKEILGERNMGLVAHVPLVTTRSSLKLGSPLSTCCGREAVANFSRNDTPAIVFVLLNCTL